MCTFLGIISVVYIFSDSGENYLFFSCVLRKQKEKNKACVLTLYQDAQIYSSKKTPYVYCTNSFYSVFFSCFLFLFS